MCISMDDACNAEAEKKLHKIRYTNETETYIRKYCSFEQPKFADYLNHIMASKNIKAADVLKNSGINRIQ